MSTLAFQPLGYNQLRTLVYADQQNQEETSEDSEESVRLYSNGQSPTEVRSRRSPPLNVDQATRSSASERIDPTVIQHGLSIQFYLQGVYCSSGDRTRRVPTGDFNQSK